MAAITSIRTKISLLFILLFGVVILPVNWLVYENSKKLIQNGSSREMQAEAESLMQRISLDPLTVPLSPNFDIQLIYDGIVNRDVLFESPDFPHRVDGAFSGYELHDTLEVFNLHKAVEGHAGVLILSIARSNIPLLDQLNTVRTYLFLFSSFSIFIAGALVFVAAGKMLKPINEVSTAAHRINAGQSIDRVPVPETNDESKILAKAINGMLTRIETTIKNQTNFFASAAHELRTPLAIMKASLSDGEPTAHLRNLLLEVERLDLVITDFLLISQLKSQTLPLRKRAESVEEIVYSTLRKCRHLSETFQPKIVVQLKNENCSYIAAIDAEKIQSVFVNLLENAIRYSAPREINVILDETDDVVIVTVVNPIRDYLENVELLAGEFKKSDKLSGGLGMGLWICDQILRLHKAELVLRSIGATFSATVILPKNSANI